MHYLDIAKKEIRSFINSLLDQSQNLTNGRSAFVIAELEKLVVAERARNLELANLANEFGARVRERCPSWFAEPANSTDFAEARDALSALVREIKRML